MNREDTHTKIKFTQKHTIQMSTHQQSKKCKYNPILYIKNICICNLHAHVYTHIFDIIFLIKIKFIQNTLSVLLRAFVNMNKKL